MRGTVLRCEGEASPIRAPSPPTPDDERWVAGYVEPNGAASNAQRNRVRQLVALAYILAISVPPLGFVLGVVVILRSSMASWKHGALIVVVSVLAAAVWILILTSGTLSTTETGY